MLRFSKIFVLSLLVVMLATSAFATTSRVKALAGTSNYINDDSNVFRWYGTLPSYSRMVMAEGGQATGGGGDVDAKYQALGFTHDFGEDHWLGTWAVFLLFSDVTDGSFFLFNPLVPFEGLGLQPGGLSVPTTKFVLMWGHQMESLAFGASFTRSDASLETSGTPASGEKSLSFTTFGVGARADLSDDLYGDVAVTLGVAGGDSLGTDKFDSGTAFDIAVRAFWEFLDDVTAVPYFSFSTFDYSLTTAAGALVPNGVTGTDVSFGVSLNMDVNTSNLLIFATELNFMNTEPSNAAGTSEVTVTNLPKFMVALESDINSWLTTRVGATKTMQKMEVTDASNVTTIETGPGAPTGTLIQGADFEWFLGVGFHVGEWDIDAVLDSDVPFRLGYWVTGFGSSDPDAPVTRVSGTYRF